MPRRCLHALLAAAGSVALAAMVWALVFRTGVGQDADIAAFAGFVELQGTALAPWAQRIAQLCNPGEYAWLAGALVLYAFWARGPRWAAAVTAVVLGTNVVTQYLKPALAAARMDGPLPDGAHVIAESWPSGHSTAAMALALCAVMVAPPTGRRIVAALGGVFAIAVAYSVVLLGWHMPSDALGGFAVAGAGACLALAALWGAEARWPAGTGRRAAGRALRQVPGATAVALAAAAVAAVSVGRAAVELPGVEHAVAFAVIAGSILVLGLSLSAAIARAGRT